MFARFPLLCSLAHLECISTCIFTLPHTSHATVLLLDRVTHKKKNTQKIKPKRSNKLLVGVALVQSRQTETTLPKKTVYGEPMSEVV